MLQYVPLEKQIFILCIFRLDYISCRAAIDHNLMKKTLIKELRTFIKMSGFATVTSIYFGGGKYMQR